MIFNLNFITLWYLAENIFWLLNIVCSFVLLQYTFLSVKDLEIISSCLYYCNSFLHKNQSASLSSPAACLKSGSEAPHWHQEERPHLPCLGLSSLITSTELILKYSYLFSKCCMVWHQTTSLSSSLPFPPPDPSDMLLLSITVIPS